MAQEIHGYSEARCPRCRRVVGWHGGPHQRPRCPACGHRPDHSQLAQVAQNVATLAKTLNGGR